MSERVLAFTMAFVDVCSEDNQAVERAVMSFLNQSIAYAGDEFDSSFDDYGVIFDGTYCEITFQIFNTEKTFSIEPIMPFVSMIEEFVRLVVAKNSRWQKTFDGVVWRVDSEIRNIGSKTP
jgi:hypothetical protein